MLSALVVRPAALDDIAAIRQLVDATRPPRQRAPSDIVATLRGQALQTARLDGTLVATGGWAPTGRGTAAQLVSLAVDPMFRGLGIGKLMVERIESHAVRAGFTDMTVLAPPRLSDFYRGLGYASPTEGTATRREAGGQVLLRKTLTPRRSEDTLPTLPVPPRRAPWAGGWTASRPALLPVRRPTRRLVTPRLH